MHDKQVERVLKKCKTSVLSRDSGIYSNLCMLNGYTTGSAPACVWNGHLHGILVCTGFIYFNLCVYTMAGANSHTHTHACMNEHAHAVNCVLELLRAAFHARLSLTQLIMEVRCAFQTLPSTPLLAPVAPLSASCTTYTLQLFTLSARARAHMHYTVYCKFNATIKRV